MTLDEFWALIDEAREGSEGPDETAERLGAILDTKTEPEIMSFLEHQGKLMEKSYTWELWGAGYVANGGCSDDGFDYFRGWILAQGRDVFEQALASPDSLADLIEEQEEAECGDMICVAGASYKNVTGDYPNGPMVRLPELGESWDFDDAEEMRERYPRLWRKLYDN